MKMLRSGIVNAEHYLEGGFLLTYFSAVPRRIYQHLKSEKITFLVDVSCMRRKRMEAFVKS
jgi:hypothetical protein